MSQLIRLGAGRAAFLAGRASVFLLFMTASAVPLAGCTALGVAAYKLATEVAGPSTRVSRGRRSA